MSNCNPAQVGMRHESQIGCMPDRMPHHREVRVWWGCDFRLPKQSGITRNLAPNLEKSSQESVHKSEESLNSVALLSWPVASSYTPLPRTCATLDAAAFQDHSLSIWDFQDPNRSSASLAQPAPATQHGSTMPRLQDSVCLRRWAGLLAKVLV